jgi:hypothetical protein
MDYTPSNVYKRWTQHEDERIVKEAEKQKRMEIEKADANKKWLTDTLKARLQHPTFPLLFTDTATNEFKCKWGTPLQLWFAIRSVLREWNEMDTNGMMYTCELDDADDWVFKIDVVNS